MRKFLDKSLRTISCLKLRVPYSSVVLEGEYSRLIMRDCKYKSSYFTANVQASGLYKSESKSVAVSLQRSLKRRGFVKKGPEVFVMEAEQRALETEQKLIEKVCASPCTIAIGRTI